MAGVGWIEGELPDGVLTRLNVLSFDHSGATELTGAGLIGNLEGFFKLETESITEYDVVEGRNVVVWGDVDSSVDDLRLLSIGNEDVKVFFGGKVLTKEVLGGGQSWTGGVFGFDNDELSIG